MKYLIADFEVQTGSNVFKEFGTEDLGYPTNDKCNVANNALVNITPYLVWGEDFIGYLYSANIWMRILMSAVLSANVFQEIYRIYNGFSSNLPSHIGLYDISKILGRLGNLATLVYYISNLKPFTE